MADNRDLASLSGNVAADEVSYSGDTTVVQLIRPVGISGSEGSKSVVELVGSAGSAAAGVLSVQGIASGTALPVSDNGGSLTVDGTVAVTNASLTTLAGAVSGAEMQVDVVAALPAGTNNIGDVDVLSVVPGTGATSLGKAEDAAHSDGDTGVMALAVRRDANTTLADTTGDYAPLQVDASGSLKVAIISGAGTGGTSATDDAAFTVASGSGTPIMGYAGADSVDSGDVGVVRMTTARGLHVHLVDTSGATASLSTTSTKAAAATLANVSGATSSTTLLASNGSRLAVEIYNDSTAVLYVKYGTTASSTSFTKLLQAGESFRDELYTGIITGIWASATGAARVTELTAS